MAASKLPSEKLLSCDETDDTESDLAMGAPPTWDRISSDPRHHTITVLEDGSFEERNFSTWSMGLKNLNTKALEGIPGFIDINDDQFWSNPNNLKPTALDLLRKFYDMG